MFKKHFNRPRQILPWAASQRLAGLDIERLSSPHIRAAAMGIAHGDKNILRNHRTMMKPQSADIINWKKAEDDPSF